MSALETIRARSGPCWYALYVRSRFEKKTDFELQRRGIESFLPLTEEIRLWSDRKKKVQEPLFRGYVFVKTDLRERINILQTDGVVHFVSIRNMPSPIPEEQINWLRIITNHPDSVRREHYIAEGERVRIIHGPFSGIEGFVLYVKDSTRVVVSLHTIAQSVSVEVAHVFVERLGAPHREPVVAF
jgi:transcription antitermination factor NusG